MLAIFLRDDASIRAEILDEVLAPASRADSVRVDVRDGVVTLAGEVATRDDADRLTRVTERVEGAVAVVNHLTCRADEPVTATGSTPSEDVAHSHRRRPTQGRGAPNA